MKIRYKTIEHERVEDAPFIGALISSIGCDFNCNNCFNQPLKNIATLEKEDTEIIKEIKINIFNRGIIFAGLEWTLQLTELLQLARLAQDSGLQTILYTGDSLTSIKKYFNVDCLYDCFDYIKCGTYKDELKGINHIEHGVTLASSNQHIYKRGVDY